MRAVKIVRRSTFERNEHFEREFKGIQKFEPISRSHEGLVDVLQIGRNDDAGYFYYVMELADDALVVPPLGGSGTEAHSNVGSAEAGTTNADRLKAGLQAYTPKTLRSEQQRLGRLPVSQCVSIGITLSSALAHLHRHGLVHRDVKPSNIIFVGGVPKLADIGLVADASEARSFVGTIGFIPPEGPGSPQADLYSLGKVLYEISTGKDRQDFPQLPPELLRATSPSPPSGERAGVRGEAVHRGLSKEAASLLELNEVLLRACHKDARQRYASADAMLADLQVLQRGQSVRRKRRVERRFILVGNAIGAGMLLTLIGAGGYFLVGVMNPHKTGMGSLQEAEAQDAVQETIITVAQQMPQFRYDPARCSFKGWLLLLTRQRIAHQFRKRNKPGGEAHRLHAGAVAHEISLGQGGAGGTPALLSGGPATVDQLPDSKSAGFEAIWDAEWENHLFATALEEVKKKVSDRQFQIFDLYVLQNWPVREVARTLRVSVAQVYLAKHRVSMLLRKEVKRVERCHFHRS
jgi:RNA polymerase sigma factor (sigma-70 family)